MPEWTKPLVIIWSVLAVALFIASAAALAGQATAPETGPAGWVVWFPTLRWVGQIAYLVVLALLSLAVLRRPGLPASQKFGWIGAYTALWLISLVIMLATGIMIYLVFYAGGARLGR